jgi:glycosyltransferase involved in cell wall biosynthesis
MKRLSIIIPIYNVETYVERCLRSLEEQDIPKDEYEIICVNDGSPDESREIVLRLQNEFDNIILIDQENQGVSRARNNGIEKATGKYLLFIDPDDFVDRDSLSGILARAEIMNAQVSFLGFTFLNVDGSIRSGFSYENKIGQVYPGTEAYFLSRGDGETDPDRMWAVLFKREFLNCNKLRFLDGMPYLEDGELIARILCLADRCIFDGKSFYQRTTRPGSATNSNLFHSDKATNGFLIAAESLKEFKDVELLNHTQKIFLNQPIAKFVLLAVNSSSGKGQFRKLVSTIRVLKKLSYTRISIDGCNNIYRFYVKMFNLSPYLAAIAMLLWPKINRLIRLLGYSKAYLL